MSAPEPADVVALLGRDDAKSLALATAHLPVVTELVKDYTRGRGFENYEPNDALAAVILTATARLTQNPEGIVTESFGPASVRRTVFEGFTLVELMLLNGYRRRTA